MSFINYKYWYIIPNFNFFIYVILPYTLLSLGITTKANSRYLSVISSYGIRNNAFANINLKFGFIPSHLVYNRGIINPTYNSHAGLSLSSIPKKKGSSDNQEYNNERSILSNIWSYFKSFFSGRSSGSKQYNSRYGSPNLGKNLNSRSNKQSFPVSSFKSLPLLDLHLHNTRGNDDFHTGHIHDLPKESPYYDLIRYTPTEILTLFIDKASNRVRDAVRTTVGSLVGSLYKYSVETTIITTTERLAALIYNLQMTGYMLCNADYLYALSRHFVPDEQQVLDNINNAMDISITPHNKTAKITNVLQNNEEDLLAFIKQLPEERANSLFDNLSTGVVEAMKVSTDIAIETMTAGIVNSNTYNNNNPSRMIIQQTGTSTMQLCFWQLALGYCFRDQEAKIELNNALNGSK